MLCIWTEPKHTHKKTSNKTHSQSLLLKNQQQQKSLHHHHHQQQYSYNTFCDFLNTWLVEMYEGFSQQWWQIAASETGRTLQTMTTQNLWRLQEVLWDSCVCACVFIKTKQKKQGHINPTTIITENVNFPKREPRHSQPETDARAQMKFTTS